MLSNKFYLTEKLPPYVFASIYQLKQQASENGFKIIDFGMGNPDSAPPDHVMQELSELSKNPQLYGYSVTGGIEILKKAICDYYQRRFGVDLDYKTQSLVTIGAKEGIASLATAISDSNNYICVPSPSYPIHTFAFVISKSNVVHINAIEASEFLQNFKNFVEKSSKKPQAVIISYPCNPTTQIADFGFYQEMVSFCKKHQIYIISDIAYCELYFDEKDKPNSIMQVKGSSDIAIEFSSVSKSYSLAGTRVGFAVGNKNLISALYKIKSYLDYGSFTPLQMVASSALSDKSDEYLIALRKLYKDRSDYFIKKFHNDLGWNIEKPKASMFVWAKLPLQFSSMSSFDFCKKMILEAGVAMTPGSSFGENGEGYVRFSMIRSTIEVDEAVKRLKKAFSYQF
ncbi:MAG: aminotransferase class I/II-fold pyridoxal phosphate-dependent enzyme [Proteobacteria bacterium]|nr:aminotransferase class I/II-fold pyridoxal phosphate-dependent enzyme [Pseudomonadota bacterium]NCA27979.1 aminotransferase class I/II-fold pyridoxal phosphate-dependent enzyme [Pseudomonadota bacterium]